MSDTYPSPEQVRAEVLGTSATDVAKEVDTRVVSLVDFLKAHPGDLEVVKAYVADLPSPVQLWIARYKKFAVALAGTILTVLLLLQAVVPVVGAGLPSSVTSIIAAAISLLTAVGVRAARNVELDPAVPVKG